MGALGVRVIPVSGAEMMQVLALHRLMVEPLPHSFWGMVQRWNSGLVASAATNDHQCSGLRMVDCRRVHVLYADAYVRRIVHDVKVAKLQLVANDLDHGERCAPTGQ